MRPLIKIPGKKDEKTPFIDRVYNLMKEGKLTREGMIQSCILEGQKYSSVCSELNRRLKDAGEIRTVQAFLRENSKEDINNNQVLDINKLIPDL